MLLVLTCSCASLPSHRTAAGAVILPAAAVEKILRQCSRDAPSAGEGTWQPTSVHINALEAALPAELLKRRAAGHPSWTNFPRAWTRQYVGIVRQGRRFVYGSFVPAGWKTDEQQPITICDGGPAIFGAEYDPEREEFTHVAFNPSF